MSRQRFAQRMFLLTALVGSINCGGSSQTGPGTTPSTSRFRATIDGAAWSSLSSTAAAGPGGNFTLIGSQVGASVTSLTLSLYSIGAPGTYPLGVSGNVVGGIGTLVTAPSTWLTPLSGAAGTVTITAISPTRIAGTFSFNAAPQTGSGAGRVISAGEFDLPVSGPATLVVPEGAGSKITGTIAGNSFNAATIAAVSPPTQGTLTLAGANTSYTVSLIVSGYTGVGSYPLGTGVSRTLQVAAAGTPQRIWGGAGGTNAGTVVVTSATSTRIKGTFTATLGPSLTNPSEAPITVSGTFELGLQ